MGALVSYVFDAKTAQLLSPRAALPLEKQLPQLAGSEYCERAEHCPFIHLAVA